MDVSHAGAPGAPGAPAITVTGSSATASGPRVPDILVRLLPKGFKGKLVNFIFQRLRDYPASRWVFALARSLPILTLGNLTPVFRYDEVREVLGRHEDFEVPFGWKMQKLNDGPNFLLGMSDGPEYRRCQQLVMRAFMREDIAETVAPIAAKYANAIVGEAVREKRPLDAVRDLLTLVTTRICEDYYGIRIEDKHNFAAWTMAMSVFIFGPPKADPASQRAAFEGGELVRPIIDCAISRAKAGDVKPGTVLHRLVRMQKEEPDLTDPVIRAYLIGMITGFVPTSSIATGNMLEMLLRRPDFKERAQTAARSGDDDLLKRCLFEALRFKPINPGPFRVCSRDTTIAAGTPRATLIPKGRVMFASTQSAMLDRSGVSDPDVFDPGRPAHHYMVLGYGLHWCVGALIAEAHAVQVFKALLQPDLERAPGERGKLQVVGVLPLHLEVTLQERAKEPPRP